MMKLKVFKMKDYKNTVAFENAISELITYLTDSKIPNQMTTLETVVYVLYSEEGSEPQ